MLVRGDVAQAPLGAPSPLAGGAAGGQAPTEKSWNFKWPVESPEQNASPVPGRWLLEAWAPVAGRKQLHTAEELPHPRITQRRRAHGFPAGHAAGLSLEG